MKKTIFAVLIICIILVPAYLMSFCDGFQIQASNIVAGNIANQKAVTLTFSGYVWNIENSGSSTNNPGPNYWTSSTNNVWVDSNGWLHLQITKTSGVWRCAEIWTQTVLGYGTYTFVVSNNAASMDKNVVLGLFTYEDDSHEVDIEFSRWGSSQNNYGWYTVQPPPYTSGYNQASFNSKLTASYSTHFFTWSQNQVSFESLQGQPSLTNPPPSSIIESFTSPISTNAAGAQAHINLWLFNGQPPSNGKSVSVVIKSFNFTPAT
jgi:hypothetical protein